MQGDAYGMFLVHYPIVLWLQYWLFDYDLPAIVKATIAFVLTVVLSWAADGSVAQDSRRDEGAVTSHRHCRSAAIARNRPESRAFGVCDRFGHPAMTSRALRRLAVHIGRQPVLER